MWHRVDLVWTDVSDESIASILRVEKSTLQPPAQAGFLEADFFIPEDGGDTFLQNVGSHKMYTAPHPRRRHSSCFNFYVGYLMTLPV
jgi:hypothetical protein